MVLIKHSNSRPNVKTNRILRLFNVGIVANGFLIIINNISMNRKDRVKEYDLISRMWIHYLNKFWL